MQLALNTNSWFLCCTNCMSVSFNRRHRAAEMSESSWNITSCSLQTGEAGSPHVDCWCWHSCCCCELTHGNQGRVITLQPAPTETGEAPEPVFGGVRTRPVVLQSVWVWTKLERCEVGSRDDFRGVPRQSFWCFILDASDLRTLLCSFVRER